MKEQLIQLAKENWILSGFYFNILNKGALKDDEAYYLWMCLLQKRLRDEHGIHVFPWCNGSGWAWEIEETNGTHISIMDIDEELQTDSGMYEKSEQALEKGLFEALQLLNN